MSRPQRLPGIAFVAEPPQPETTLPRMDIAAFVGFAATGPVDTPVAVEDEVRFREVFGPDLPLAWDLVTGGMDHALLGPSVRAFFRNGGRRCWVVRVAGRNEQAPVSQRLPLPGLLARGEEGNAPAVARARAGGSWGDGLRVACFLAADSLTLLDRSPGRLCVAQGARALVLPGDLIRLWYADGSLEFALVDSLDDQGDSLWLDAPRQFGFVPVSGEVALEMLRLPDGQGGVTTLDVFPDLTSPAGDECLDLVVELPDGASRPQPGMLLPARVEGRWDHALSVGEVALEPEPDSPSLRGVRLGVGVLWREEEATPESDRTPTHVQRLTLGLDVHHAGEEAVWHLDRLGFSDAHPRAWNRLPTDAQLYPLPDSPRPAPDTGMADLVDHPRFPLAGSGKKGVFLPLGLETDRSSWGTVLGDTTQSTALARDGLESIDETLFYDERLAPERVRHRLAEAAYHWRYQYQQGRPLYGLHSLYFLDEVTLVGIPDAVLPGWEEVAQQDPAEDLLLPPPVLGESDCLGEGEEYAFRWSAVPGVRLYRLQVAVDPMFQRVPVQADSTETELAVTLPAPCAGWRWIRVRAEKGDRIGPWSNTVECYVRSSDFRADASRPPQAPDLHAVESLGGDRYRLAWESPAVDAVYALEEATEPDFSDSRELTRNDEISFTLIRPIRQATYFRVRMVDPDSPWSVTRFLLPEPEGSWQTTAPAPGGPAWLPRVHEAMLRMAASRADLLCTLTVPRHFRSEEVLQYLEGLAGRFADLEETALSYGALYHPWVLSGRVGEGASWTTPDGLAVGHQAARALHRGAWVAPANMPFTDVLGLTPALDDGDWVRLHAAQVNLVRRHPRGFLCLSASTLDRDAQLRPINVRRLLILLRRLALREGRALVFEPNDDSLRRRVKRLFESLLRQLYERGAFAGRRPEQAYQVVTDETVNPPSEVDRGRLVVELRVAPSQPLEFLTVRLVQLGNGDLLLEGS